MTKEPIMIDGVDASECKYYLPPNGCDNSNTMSLQCDLNPSCYYKQLQRAEKQLSKDEEIQVDMRLKIDELNGLLKRKEQECEELREKVNSYNCSTNCYKYQQSEKYKQALQEIKNFIYIEKAKVFVDMEDFWEQILQKCEVIKD